MKKYFNSEILETNIMIYYLLHNMPTINKEGRYKGPHGKTFPTLLSMFQSLKYQSSLPNLFLCLEKITQKYFGIRVGVRVYSIKNNTVHVVFIKKEDIDIVISNNDLKTALFKAITQFLIRKGYNKHSNKVNNLDYFHN
jgi:hypothetical protein